MIQQDAQPEHASHGRWRVWLRRGWPVLVAVAILWFPFDWLATVWPAFGTPFRVVFRTAQTHFVGHTTFFFVVGMIALTYFPRLRRQPLAYFAALVACALVQETVQAIFRGEMPTYTDFNAFTGDALGGALAFALWTFIRFIGRGRKSDAAREADASIR